MRAIRTSLVVIAATAAVAASSLLAPTAASADPVVGACFNYTATAAKDISSDAPAIGCDSAHTAETYYVRTLPETFGLPSTASLGKRISAGAPCTVAAMNAYLGMPDRTLPSRFITSVKFPTDAQWQAGERWMRCDVVLQAGLKLRPLTGTAAAFVAATPQETFNFCTPREPNATATEAYPCTNPKKNWIKVLDKELGGAGSKFPGRSKVETSTRRLCEKMGKKYNGKVQFPGWWAIWPTGSGWRNGTRTAQCFVPYKQYLAELAQNAPKPTPAPSPAPTPAPTPTPPAETPAPTPSPSA